jgi:23S rRNA 5-hydroxycytidine C2501 synthase
MDSVELLAPARDLETGQTAINCGADAVYIGAARFGAREAAGNPLDEIEQLARYAHRYWARVYVTVNTLLHDDELPEAVRLIHQLYNLGADAIIFQDAGLLECDLPPVALFASTQMHNHTPARVAFLEQVGVRRAILARELSLDEIRAIHAAAPSIELESFIHGALCVSYSGQCYASYAIGGRSGNRGQCAQPCRRPYRLLDAAGQTLAAGRHLLSLRDLNLSGSLGELLEAGVRSFKIEGRLKDRAYVMNVVAHYRLQLDELLSAGILTTSGSQNSAAASQTETALRPASSGRIALDFTPDPAKTFNRGFTTYFLRGRGDALAAWDTPKPVGEPLGRVAGLGQRSFSLDTPHDLLPGDGLCWLAPAGSSAEAPGSELLGAQVQRVEGRQVFPSRLEGLVVGAQVFRNFDRAFRSALDKSRAGRQIGLRFHLQPASDSLDPRASSPLTSGLLLTVMDSDGVSAQVHLPGPLEPATQPETARQTLLRQLQKLGGTGFECLEITFDLPLVPFLPVAALNGLRRCALEALAAAREQQRPRLPARAAPVPGAAFPTSTLSFEGNVLNRQAEAFYRRYGVTKIEPAAESGLDMAGRKVMTTRYCLRQQLGACRKYPLAPPAAPTRLNEPLTLLDEQGVRYPLRFNCTLCVMEVYYQEDPP